MKGRIFSVAAAGVFALSVLAPAVWAGGSHAGGHNDSSIGKAGVAANVKRTVAVEMSDAMRFTPAAISVNQGETIRFVVKNAGKLKHEFVLGTEKDLKEHYDAMKKYPGMEHDDPSMISVGAGKTGEVIWQFAKPGKVLFACLQPGHYEAGMRGQVNVLAIKKGKVGEDSSHIH